MTRADFYVLQASQQSDRLYFCCRLAEKALHNKLRVLMWLPDTQCEHKLDNLLWSYIPESFIPHVLANEASSAQIHNAPIVLSSQEQPLGQSEKLASQFGMLINLRPEAPQWIESKPLEQSQIKVEQTTRIAEIVIQDEKVLNSTRTNYAFYRTLGIDVTTHPIGK